MKAGIVSSSSTSRRNWEEDMYWTNFLSLHFCQFLSGNFNLRLGIPKKFAENIEKNLPESLIIRGPSGETWDVGLAVENDVVLQMCHSSLCEKEVSYFQRKCKHGVEDEDDDRSGAKRKREDDDTMILHATPTSDGKCTSKEDSSKEDGVVTISLGPPDANGSAVVSTRGRPRKGKLFCYPGSQMKTPKKEPVVAISWIISDESMQESIKKSPAIYPVYCLPNRRPATTDEVSSA